jgi:hypothetical protein
MKSDMCQMNVTHSKWIKGSVGAAEDPCTSQPNNGLSSSMAKEGNSRGLNGVHVKVSSVLRKQ